MCFVGVFFLQRESKNPTLPLPTNLGYVTIEKTEKLSLI